MKFLFLLALFFKLNFCCSQTNFHGSLVLAAVGNDGIIMACDSRLVFFNNKIDNGKDLAYFDECVKVYRIGKFAIGFVGSAAIENFFMEEIIEVYKRNTFSKDIMIDKLIPHFLNYCTLIFSEAGEKQLTKSKIFAIGYKNGNGLIYTAINENGKWDFRNFNQAVSSGKTGFVDMVSPKMKCKELADIATNSIGKYIFETKNTSVGGSISVLKITKNGESVWLSNPPKKFPWATTVNLLIDYFDNKVDISFFDLKYKAQLEEIWKEEIKNAQRLRR